MKLLICGNRNVFSGMRRYVNKVVRRVRERGDVHVLVGDAKGVDKMVIEACDQLCGSVTVYGAYGKFRKKTKTGMNIAIEGNYIERDEIMISQSEMCCAIWDGKSKGTDRNFTRTIQGGKGAFRWCNGKC